MLDPDGIQDRLFVGDVPSVEVLGDFPKTSFTYSAVSYFTESRCTGIPNAPCSAEYRKSKMALEITLGSFLAAVNLVLSAWGDTPLVQRHVLSLARNRDDLFPHALALRSFYMKHYMNNNPKGNLQLAKLMNESGWYQHERGNSQDIKPFLTLALNICNDNPGPESTQMLSDIHNGLAAAANETNDAKGCLHHTQKLLELRLDAFAKMGKGNIQLAIPHNEIEIAWVMNNEYQKAIDEFEASI